MSLEDQMILAETEEMEEELPRTRPRARKRASKVGNSLSWTDHRLEPSINPLTRSSDSSVRPTWPTPGGTLKKQLIYSSRSSALTHTSLPLGTPWLRCTRRWEMQMHQGA